MMEYIFNENVRKLSKTSSFVNCDIDFQSQHTDVMFTAAFAEYHH